VRKSFGDHLKENIFLFTTILEIGSRRMIWTRRKFKPLGRPNVDGCKVLEWGLKKQNINLRNGFICFESEVSERFLWKR
jgi:hypothetical protein